jgi:hypothetical protein
MERPEESVRIRRFEGLVSNRGAFPEKPGEAKVQTNLRCRSPGQLEVRGGMRQLQFEA